MILFLIGLGTGFCFGSVSIIRIWNKRLKKEISIVRQTQELILQTQELLEKIESEKNE